MAWLTREALHRVLQSLLVSELRSLRPGQPSFDPLTTDDTLWPESLTLGETDSLALGCDSLDLLRLASAVNEMFCLYDRKVERDLLAAPTLGDWLDIIEFGWNRDGERITFTTSGSTGVPKLCTHPMQRLQVEIEFLARFFADTCRIVALTPPHHIYGFLFTAMLPTFLQVPVLEASSTSPGTLKAELRPGDLLVSTPSRWEWLARSIPQWPEGMRGVTSSAPCPEHVKEMLAGNGLLLTEVYGSSETAGIGLRTYPEQRYSLMPQWSWADRTGNAAQLRHTSGDTAAVQDTLEIAPDGGFTVVSRIDGAVQVGGTNVYPSRLAEQLRSQPGVADATVRLSADPASPRLKAFIVPDGTVQETLLREQLALWAKALPAPERVRSFRFGTELPRNAMGKLTDWNEVV